MPERIEREFKLRIPSEDRLQALAARLGGARAIPVRQVNHFFDTVAGDLRAARIALRLREEGGRCVLTLKGPLLGAEAALAERPEEELEVSPSTAAAILAGTLAPLDVLEHGLAGRPLVERAGELVRSLRLERLGAFENERLRIGPLAFPSGSSAPLVFELDRTRYPDGCIERELEVELPAGARPSEVERGLAALFAELGMALEPTPSKAARFFRSLTVGGPGTMTES